MAYTTIDKPTDYFETVTYAGGTTDISSLDFQPDWVWGKKRDGAENHGIFDSVRGATKTINSNTTAAESTRGGSLTSFDNDGFTMGGSDGIISNSGSTYVAWCWRAGTSFTNDASSTGVGSIDSTGSFNNDAGFSIVSYTGTGSAGTIKHGLNSTPSWILVKNRIDGSIYWYNYLKVLGNNTELYLNGQDAAPNSTGAWNTTSPTSSVFSVGSHGGTNASGEATIAYCFAEKQGYSKFGSYTGNNNADGAFVYTGFKPAWLLVFAYEAGNENWMLIDNKRDGFNVENEQVFPNTNDDEESNDEVDLLSNGFKLRRANTRMKGSIPYIYMAFAESPFVTSTGVPTTAR